MYPIAYEKYAKRGYQSCADMRGAAVRAATHRQVWMPGLID